MWLMSFPVGWGSNYLVNNGIVRPITSRKLFNSMSNFGSAAGFIWLAFVGCDTTWAIVALVVTSSLSSGKYGGYNVSSLKIF